ncbi:MAG: SAM-dependent methyltransferase [Deltaproteobacteria bacterium]
MNQLAESIKSEIRKRGPLTFAHFMELALYHPELGYYSPGIERIGKEGDYYTSPYVHQAFGEILARFIVKGAGHFGGADFDIIEFGGGKGLLASDILKYMKRDHPDVYDRVRYHIVEHNPHQRKEAEKGLEKHRHKLSLLSSLSELGERNIDGVIISNEFVDALPFHRAKFSRGELLEIYVALKENEFVELKGKPSSKEIASYLEDYGLQLEEGQELEINLNAGRWIKETERILDRGLILTIDYGYLAPELFSPHRMKGTYKCLHKHQINENPYVNIGEQDITAHVDFSNLIRVGEHAGLNEIIYTTQGQFLLDWGILDIIEDGESGAGTASGKDTIAAGTLFLPQLMGDKFKVLVQGKNIEDETRNFYPESPLKISFGVL